MRDKPLRLTAVIFTASLALVACTPSTGAREPEVAASPALILDAPSGFAEYYGQEAQFTDCEGDQVTMPRMAVPKDLQNYKCATLEAPLNWADPDSEAIELAVAAYQPRPGSERPMLFFNLGGPGGDAVQSLSAFAEMIVPKEVADNYTLIAVDPRGVGESTPVTCWDDAERDEVFSEPPDPRDAPLEEIVAQADAEMVELYDQCKERSGDILDFVDTSSAARDFDMVRAVLGQETMNYLGYSYGTALGVTYAGLFPDRVGRFVLDGAMDPARNINELSAMQAAGMEEALYHWIETCQQGDSCPLSGDLESGKTQVSNFLKQLREKPLPTDDPQRPLTETLARTGIVGSLYSDESYPLLEMGLQMAHAGDGSVLLLLADFYNGREDDGTFNNSQDAFLAVSALDYEPVGTPEEWQALAQKVAEENPVLGDQFGFASAGLASWGAKSGSERGPVKAQGAPPIVVIGTTHDPATPYPMAVSMADTLSSGVLVTYDGWGHGAYQQGGSKCLLDVVNKYLVGGEVPAEGTVCES